MIKTVTYEQEPTLFEDIVEFSIDSQQDHRRNGNFYRKDIIEFKPEHKEFFPEIENFEQYLGTWRTNKVIWDDDLGFDEEFSKLTRVKQVEKIKISYEWVEEE